MAEGINRQNKEAPSGNARADSCQKCRRLRRMHPCALHLGLGFFCDQGRSRPYVTLPHPAHGGTLECSHMCSNPRPDIRQADLDTPQKCARSRFSGEVVG